MTLAALPSLGSTHRALLFGKNPTSYILLPSNTTLLRRAFSVCGWVNRHTNHHDFFQYWLTYGVRGSIQEFGISDSGHSYQFGDGIMPRYQSLTVEEYHHMCHTWGEGRVVLYYDGVEIGSEETPSDRDLVTEGTLILGQFVGYRGVENIEKYRYFGGELTEVNILTRQVTKQEVEEMYSQGICSNYAAEDSEDVFISWQGILGRGRFGDVQEVEVCCSGECGESEEFVESGEGEEVEEQDLKSVWDFLFEDKFYNQLVTRDVIEEMHKYANLLADFVGHKIDSNLINHLKKHRD